ncbi:MAG: hypothetical protein ACTHOG_11630 [Marmoricola sp.]
MSFCRRSLALAVAALSLAACGSSSTPDTGPRLITYPGDGLSITTKNVTTALKDTSPSFQAFVTKQLHVLWQSGGSVPGCQSAALISLTAYRADGFASASNEGLFGSDTCARGGNSALYAEVRGVWKEIAASQSGYACSDLVKYKVPAAVAGRTCLDASGTPHPYRG